MGQCYRASERIESMNRKSASALIYLKELWRTRILVEEVEDGKSRYMTAARACIEPGVL